MNIAVLGYYGFGNVGDEVIFDNLRHYLAPHTVVPIPLGLRNSGDTVERLNAFDFVILGGGGLYRKEPPSPFTHFDKWGRGLSVPLGVLGLGVSCLAPRFEAATRSLIERSLFFQVRDEESRRLLGHPKVELAPDLTFFRPLAPAPRSTRAGEVVCGVNLRPVQPAVEQWVDAALQLDSRKLALPFSVHPTLGDREALLSIDPDCPERFDLESFASIDILIGTAFHSIVFAVQMGIPVIAINYDPKVERFMSEVGLAEYMLNWDEAHRLPACYESALARRGLIRQQMLAYRAEAQRRLQDALAEPRSIIERQAHKSERRVGSRPSAPVSIIVHNRRAPAEAVRRTLASCLNQTHSEVDVIVVGAPQTAEQVESLSGQPDGSDRLRPLALENGAADWVSAGLGAATGDYVTWLEMGDWFAEDAVASLLGALEKDQTADVAQAGFFLTRNGVIERKIYLDRRQKPGKAGRRAPFLFARRTAAKRIWRQMQNNDAVWTGPAIPLQNALFFKSSSAGESDLYQGVAALGRGDFARGERLLAQAATAGWQTGWTETNDVVELIATTARNTAVTARPEEFVNLVLSKLPGAPRNLRLLKRRALAQLAMRRFFETYTRNTRRETARTLLAGVTNDPSWLGNRGVWVAVIRLCLGRV